MLRRVPLLLLVVIVLAVVVYSALRSPSEPAPATATIDHEPPAKTAVVAPSPNPGQPPASPPADSLHEAAAVLETAPPSEPLAPTIGSLCGRVVDASGQPISGATVYLITANEPQLDSDDAAVRTTSDPEGRWQFRFSADGVTDLGAAKSGYAATLVRDVPLVLDRMPEPIDLVLGTGAEISGHVRNPKDEPLAGVRATAVAGDSKWMPPRRYVQVLPDRGLLSQIETEEVTDESGAYALRGLATGAEYRVSARGDTVSPRPRTGEGSDRRVVAPASEIDFTVTKSGVILVYVRDAETDAPVGGCTVKLGGSSFGSSQVPEWWTDAVRFEHGISEGRCQVTVAARGYEGSEPQDVEVSSANAPEVTVKLHRKNGPAPGAIRVIAKDDDGRPVPWMVASIYGGGGEMPIESAVGRGDTKEQIESGIRDAKNIEPGHYGIRVTSQSRDYLDGRAECDVQSNETTSVEITVPSAGRLLIDVKDSAGEYFKGYKIAITDDAGKPADAEIMVRSGANTDSMQRDVIEYPGRVRAGRLRPGRYTLSFSLDGYEPRTETVEVKRGEERLVEVVLRER